MIRSAFIRLPVGIVLLVMAVMAYAAAEEAPTYVLFSQTDAWRTHLILHTDDPAGAEVEFSNWQVGPKPRAVLAPGESFIYKDLKTARTEQGPVGLADVRVTKGSAEIATVAEFRDRFGNIASFTIPPITHSLAAGPLQARLVQNDADYQTSIVLFNQGQRGAFITASVFDEKNRLLGHETITAEPAGALTFYQLLTTVRAGRVQFGQGISGIGCGGCQSTEPVYGVALVNWKTGGSARVVPLTPIR